MVVQRPELRSEGHHCNIRRLIAGEEQEKMTPYFCGFTGEIIAETGKRQGSYTVRGRIERKDETTLFISELASQEMDAGLQGLPGIDDDRRREESRA